MQSDAAEHVDDERDIPTLLAKNRALIDELKATLANELKPEHDDIFLLRYVLSYKTLETATKHIRAGLEYRRNNPYLELEKQGKMHPQAARIREFTCASYHGRKRDGGPIQVIRAGLTNISGLFQHCKVEDIIEEMTLSKENAYVMCDKATRESGRLVKQLVIFDMASVGWIYPSSELIGSQNKASAIAKDLYPQLLEKVVIINAPWFFQQLWKIAKMMLSESLTGKVGMCNGTIAPDGAVGCPWASKNVIVEELPSFVGGTCRKCVPGCVGNVTNDCTQMKAQGVAVEAPPPEELEATADAAAAALESPATVNKGWLSGWW